MKFTLPARLLKAAQLFQGKNDIRYYLNGVHIYPDGRVFATNGAILLDAKLNQPIEGLPEPIVLSVIGSAIPSNAEQANIAIDEDRRGYCTFIDAKGHLMHKSRVTEMRAVELIEFKDINIDAKVEDWNATESVSNVTFNPNLMAVVGDAMESLMPGKKRRTSVKIEFSLSANVLVISPLNPYEDWYTVKMYVMLTRH